MKKSQSKPTLSHLTPAQVNQFYPEIFDEWQHKNQVQENVKLSSRLLQDIKIVSKLEEKASWTGIPKMTFETMGTHSALLNHKKKNETPALRLGTTPPQKSKRNAFRK